MSIVRRVSLCAAVWVICTASTAHAAVIWTESIDGDLSFDSNNPTVVAQPLTVGTSDILGTSTKTPLFPGVLIDLDAAAFDVASLTQVTAIQLATDQTTRVDLYQIIASTPQLLASNLTVNSGDLLATLSVSPLGEGSYVVRIGNNGTTGSTMSYTLSMVVTPEPATAGLFAAALGVVWRRPSRRDRQA
jgi:hypothetical protein